MNILILSDSRGEAPHENTYIHKLISSSPEYSVTYNIQKPTFHLNTINKLEEFVINLNKEFDILIIQVGIHDNGVIAWPKQVWEYYLTTKYRKFEKSYLYQNPPFVGGNLFFYANYQEEYDCFQTFRKFCKKIIFLAPHGIFLSVYEDDEVHLGNFYRNLNLKNINRISKLSDYTIHLPLSKEFKLNYTQDAGIHYNNLGHEFIAEEIKKMLKALERKK